jgi:hypothetical protein
MHAFVALACIALYLASRPGPGSGQSILDEMAVSSPPSATPPAFERGPGPLARPISIEIPLLVPPEPAPHEPFDWLPADGPMVSRARTGPQFSGVSGARFVGPPDRPYRDRLRQ